MAICLARSRKRSIEFSGQPEYLTAFSLASKILTLDKPKNGGHRMRLTPSTKVFMYMATMSGDTDVMHDTLWRDRYRLDPLRTMHALMRNGYIQAGGALGDVVLTAKGQSALSDIADQLWIHEYYLPDVIDFAHARRRFWERPMQGYVLVEHLLDEALVRYGDDPGYAAVLLRHRLKLELDTQHDQAAAAALMALIVQDLEPGDEFDAAAFAYATTWVKITSFDKQTLKTLLGRLNWSLSDFEMHFSDWLGMQPRKATLFTHFEIMTIVMYEIADNAGQLTALYAAAAHRMLRNKMLPAVDEKVLL